MNSTTQPGWMVALEHGTASVLQVGNIITWPPINDLFWFDSIVGRAVGITRFGHRYGSVESSIRLFPFIDVVTEVLLKIAKTMQPVLKLELDIRKILDPDHHPTTSKFLNSLFRDTAVVLET